MNYKFLGQFFAAVQCLQSSRLLFKIANDRNTSRIMMDKTVSVSLNSSHMDKIFACQILPCKNLLEWARDHPILRKSMLNKPHMFE